MNTPESFREQPASRVILPSSENLRGGRKANLKISEKLRGIYRRGVHFRSCNIGVSHACK
jgi:hypothetical protein